MRVLLVDDHTLFRSGLTELLKQRGIEVADAMGDGEEAVRMAACLDPEVVLLDIRMPRLSGLDVLKRIRDLGMSMPVAMLTTSREEWDVVRAIRHGASGYLLKDMEPDALVKALHDIRAGKTVVAPELTHALARGLQGDALGHRQKSPGDPFAELTAREREILCHMAEGQSNKVIARHLGISDGTVKLHVKAVLRKLGVHSRVEAAVLAVEQGACAPKE